MDVTGAVTSTIATITTDGITVLTDVLGVFAGLVVLGLAIRWVKGFIARKR